MENKKPGEVYLNHLFAMGKDFIGNVKKSWRSMSDCFLEVFGVVSNLGLNLFWVNEHDLFELFLGDVTAGPIEIFIVWDETEWAFVGLGCSFNTANHPGKNTGVLTISWPHEFAILLTEPVDVENVWKLDMVFGIHFKVVVEVVSHMVTAEWKHSEWITT